MYFSLFNISLSISVAPVLPTEVRARNLSTSRVQLSWFLPVTHPDQFPTSLTVLLTNLTDLTASLHYPGSSSNIILDVVPGMRYQAVIIVRNKDEELSTLPLEFRATPSGESHTHTCMHIMYVHTSSLKVLAHACIICVQP